MAGLAMFLHAGTGRGDFEFGVLSTLTRYDQALPLLGIGLALAQAPLGLCIAGIVVFLVGILLGGLVSDWTLNLLSSHPGYVGYLFVTKPACCAIVGAALALPRHLAAWLVLPVAFFVGAALGLVITFNDPTPAQWSFAGGAVLAGVWLVVPPLLLWRQFARPWFAIPARIFGSWLIAIGAMVGAAQLIPRPQPAEFPATVESPVTPGEPLEIDRPAGQRPIVQ